MITPRAILVSLPDGVVEARAILSSLYTQKMLSDIQNLCRRETKGNREEARFDYYEVEGMIK